jgi:hypothetical protein
MSLKKAYLYLVSIISLVIMVVAGIMLINLALKAWVFKDADRYASYPCLAKVIGPDGRESGCNQEEIDAQKKADEQNRKSQRQQSAAQAIAMILVATPVWFYHWRAARKEV